MRSEIFPGLAAAYREWLADGDYEPLGAIAEVGREHWVSLGHEMLDLHRAGARDVPRAIARLVGENVL